MSDASPTLPPTQAIEAINDGLITSELGCHLIYFFDQWDPNGATLEQITTTTKLSVQDVLPWLEAMRAAGSVDSTTDGLWTLDELGYATMFCAYRDRLFR